MTRLLFCFLLLALLLSSSCLAASSSLSSHNNQRGWMANPVNRRAVAMAAASTMGQGRHLAVQDLALANPRAPLKRTPDEQPAPGSIPRDELVARERAQAEQQASAASSQKNDGAIVAVAVLLPLVVLGVAYLALRKVQQASRRDKASSLGEDGLFMHEGVGSGGRRMEEQQELFAHDDGSNDQLRAGGAGGGSHHLHSSHHNNGGSSDGPRHSGQRFRNVV